MNNDIFFARTPRLWMQKLSDQLGIFHTNEKTIMFNEKKTLKKMLLEFSKNSILPPLEWLIDYERFVSLNQNHSILIEMGSKILKTEKKYISYIENGFGLFSFNTNKINRFNIKILERKISEENFLGFVFYSRTAEISTKNLLHKVGIDSTIFEKKNLGIIYPYSGLTPSLPQEKIVKNILFCSSSFELKGGRELLNVFQKIKKNHQISLTIITSKSAIYKYGLNNIDGITPLEFSLNSDIYENALNKADIVVHPTYFDTHALSLLDAIKLNIPVIATNTFAIRDMVTNGINGLLIENPHNPYSDETSLPTFQGTAMNYMHSLLANPPSKSLENDLLLAIQNMLENYQLFTLNINNKVDQLNYLSDAEAINKWGSLLDNLKRL